MTMPITPNRHNKVDTTSGVVYQPACRRAEKEQAQVPPELTALTEPHETDRAEKIAKARQLINDPTYPSPEVIEKVAQVLSKHIQKGGPSPLA